MSTPPKKKLKQSSLDQYTDRHINHSNQSSEWPSGVPEVDYINTNARSTSPMLSQDRNDNAEDSTTADTQSPTAHYSLSPDIFTDSASSPGSQSNQSEDEIHSPSLPCALGTDKSELPTSLSCPQTLPPLKSEEDHTILFQLPYVYSCDKLPSPHPSCYDSKRDRWDGFHVRMPCSHYNEYPVNRKAVKRWSLIEKALLQDLSNTVQLQEAILSYNARYADRWDFSVMHRLFYSEYTTEQREDFFGRTLKDMVSLALQLPHLCTQAIPLLRRGMNHSVTLSQQQVACLLANAFFCTFPRRNAHHKSAEYVSYPSINFNSLFYGLHMPSQVEKLKCIIHYFTRVTKHMPTGNVTFKRQGLTGSPDWINSTSQLTRLHISSTGRIESDGQGMLQVDFANKFLGGGVLGHGCVQEEIRFVVCPEMILSRLFTEQLDKHECLIMTGCEQFSDYSGYAGTFRWKSNHVDPTPRDSWGRLMTEVVAIDAFVVQTHTVQFKWGVVYRELNKAYTGFVNSSGVSQNLPAVCTGNWGCGAFGGDKRLKALIQLIAAAESKRDVCYFTFGDADLCHDIHNLHMLLALIPISDIIVYIQRYYREVCLKSRGRPLINICEFIVSSLTGSSENVDDTSQASET